MFENYKMYFYVCNSFFLLKQFCIIHAEKSEYSHLFFVNNEQTLSTTILCPFAVYSPYCILFKILNY